jgi:hypothetical protein
MCTFRLTLQRAGTTKGAQGLGARIYHGRYAALPPTAGPPLAPMTNIFFRRQDRNHRKSSDSTLATTSLGHQDRARVRPDQDRPSGSSAATRTSPTRPRTAMPTHASTTGSKITGTLVGDSSPGQHPKPEYVLDEEVTPRGTSDEKRVFIL